MIQPVFVGRERELARLDGFLDQALAGQGQVCFVIGEAGSGKTALVLEFARRAQEDNPHLLVAIGTCNAQTGLGDPYLPFREVLSLLTGDVQTKLEEGTISEENATRLRRLLVRSIEVLVDVGPHLVNIIIPGSRLIALLGKAVADKAGWLKRLESLAEASPDTTEPVTAGSQETHIFEEYTGVLQEMAKGQPLLLILDDLQWSDASSIGLLFHIGRRLEGSRILVVGTYRPEDVALGRSGERHPLEALVNEFRRYFGDILLNLGETPQEESLTFIDGLLDSELNLLDEDFRRALYEHTGGHALFTIESLRELRQRGHLLRDERGRWVQAPDLDWRTLPERVEAIVEERISRLDELLRETLTIASVEGEQFTAEVIARVQAVQDRLLVRRLSEDLERQHGLVQAHGIGRTNGQRLSFYRFRHKPLHSYLYSSLDEAEKVYLHLDVGEALESLHGAGSDEIAAQLARHFEIAGDTERALAYLQRAGEQAQASHAPQEAVGYFTRALHAADTGSITPPAALHQARGRALKSLGEFDDAHSDYVTALDLAHSSTDTRGEWQALIGLGRLWASRDYAQAGRYYERALERAHQLGDSSTIARTLNRIGNWHLNMDRPGEALRYHEESLSVFRRLEEPRGVAETLDLLGMASALSGDLVTSTDYYAEAASVFRSLEDPQGLVSSLASIMSGDYLSQTMVPAMTGRDMIEEQALTALRIARDINYRSGEAYILLSLGAFLGPHGEYDRALRHARAGLSIAEELGHQQWIGGAHCALGALYLDLLAPHSARDHLEKARESAQETGSLFWQRCAAAFLASTCILQQDYRIAKTILDAALPVDTPKESMGQRLAWLARGELALARGEPGRALDIADELVASAANLSPGESIPRISMLRAASLGSLDRFDAAVDELRAAELTARTGGVRSLLWRIHLALGSLFEATGRREDADREFRVAEELVEELATSVSDDDLRQGFQLRALSK